MAFNTSLHEGLYELSRSSCEVPLSVHLKLFYWVRKPCHQTKPMYREEKLISMTKYIELITIPRVKLVYALVSVGEYIGSLPEICRLMRQKCR